MPSHRGSPDRFGSPTSSVFSTYAQFQMPLERAHIVRLKDILQPVEADKEEMIKDNQLYGFRYNDWLHQNERKFPVMSLEGLKNTFGTFIKTNWNKKKKIFTFSVRRKASSESIRALTGFIDTNLPPIDSVTVKTKRRKTYDIQKGIHTATDLENSIHHELKGKAKVLYKLDW
jgi:hypothetical protein